MFVTKIYTRFRQISQKFVITDAQMNAILNFVEQHNERRPQLMICHQSKTHEFTTAWETLASEMNQIPGAYPRTATRWRKAMRKAAISVRDRLDKLADCDPNLANILRDSFTAIDRRIIKLGAHE